MKKRTTYTNEPMGKVSVIRDFLPSPEELALKDETVKITIALSKTSVDFFKKEAKKYNTQYQKMIRKLLDWYVDQYDETPLTTRSTVPRKARGRTSRGR